MDDGMDAPRWLEARLRRAAGRRPEGRLSTCRRSGLAPASQCYRSP